MFSDIALQIELESPLLRGNNLVPSYKICGFKLNTDKVVKRPMVISAFVLVIT